MSGISSGSLSPCLPLLMIVMRYADKASPLLRQSEVHFDRRNHFDGSPFSRSAIDPLTHGVQRRRG